MLDKQPIFSIIIPSYNRPQQLNSCLDSLLSLDYSADHFEVIVVDDGSRSPLDHVLTEFASQLDIKLIRQINSGPAAARNNGAKHAKGIFLAFTDDDSTPEPNWLAAFEQRFNDTPDCMIAGKVVNTLSTNAYATTSQLIIGLVYQRYNSCPEQASFVTACNAAVSTEQFHRVGGFDSSFRFSEDREFADRWVMKGYRICYAPEVINHHHDYLDSFYGFCIRYFQYGQGAYAYHKIRKTRGSGSMQKDIKFHSGLGNWLFYPFKHFKVKQATSIASLLLIWQFSNASGFFWSAIVDRFTTDQQDIEFTDV